MASSTIEISTGAARDILPCLEAQVQDLENQMESIADELVGKRALVAEIKSKLSTAITIQPVNGQPARKRLPKGMADDTILTLLKSNADGLSLPEIVKRTGINYSTAFKIFTDKSRNNGRFESTGDVWKMKK